MVSAIRYMHAHHVLHRDLKTANIFLTKDSIVKLGDFGISKILSTKQGGAAQTVLGKITRPNSVKFKTDEQNKNAFVLITLISVLVPLPSTIGKHSNLGIVWAKYRADVLAFQCHFLAGSVYK